MSEGAKDWWVAPLRFSKYDLQSLSLTSYQLKPNEDPIRAIQTQTEGGLTRKKKFPGWAGAPVLLVVEEGAPRLWSVNYDQLAGHDNSWHTSAQLLPTQLDSTYTIPMSLNSISIEWFSKDKRFLPQDNRNNAYDNLLLWHQISCLYNSPMSGVQLTLICHENRQGCNKLLNYICVEKHYC